MKKIAIAFWATGKYLDMVPDCWEHLDRYFCPDAEKYYLVHTDGDLEDAPENVVKIDIPDYGFPDTFNKTFEVYSRLENLVKEWNCNWFMSFDVDLKVNEEILYAEFFDVNKKYFGVHHPCHFMQMTPHNQYPGSFENNPKSTAYIGEEMPPVYYQACLWGGNCSYVFDMINEIDLRVKADLINGVQAKYFEESHLNKWFSIHSEDTKTLGSEYAFPELFEKQCDQLIEKKIIHTYKDNSAYGNNLW